MTLSSSHADLEAIRRRHSLSGLIGKRVKLQRTAKGFKGLCPFHDERSDQVRAPGAPLMDSTTSTEYEVLIASAATWLLHGGTAARPR